MSLSYNNQLYDANTSQYLSIVIWRVYSHSSIYAELITPTNLSLAIVISQREVIRGKFKTEQVKPNTLTTKTCNKHCRARCNCNLTTIIYANYVKAKNVGSSCFSKYLMYNYIPKSSINIKTTDQVKTLIQPYIVNTSLKHHNVIALPEITQHSIHLYSRYNYPLPTLRSRTNTVKPNTKFAQMYLKDTKDFQIKIKFIINQACNVHYSVKPIRRNYWTIKAFKSTSIYHKSYRTVINRCKTKQDRPVRIIFCSNITSKLTGYFNYSSCAFYNTSYCWVMSDSFEDFDIENDEILSSNGNNDSQDNFSEEYLDQTLNDISGELSGLRVNSSNTNDIPNEVVELQTNQAIVERDSINSTVKLSSGVFDRGEGQVNIENITPRATNSSEPLNSSDKESTQRFVIPKLKRNRDSESSTEGRPAKIHRPFVNMANLYPMAALAATDAHVVDILPETEGVMFTDHQLKTLGISLTRALYSAENFPELKFEFSGPERGKYRIICSNAATRDWTIDIIPRLEGLWTGANLRIVQPGPPPTLIRATVQMSMPTMEPNDFFTIIGAQNPTINTSNWKLFNRNKPVGGKQLWVIGVDDTTIQPLRDIGCRPYCGMNRVRINLP